MEPTSVLTRLMTVIESRKTNPPEKSYTSMLFQGGLAAIGEKILEEAAEVIDAAKEVEEGGHTHLVHEAADLLYHLLVMLAFRDVQLPEVERELARRFGISGIDEKASRGSP